MGAHEGRGVDREGWLPGWAAGCEWGVGWGGGLKGWWASGAGEGGLHARAGVPRVLRNKAAGGEGWVGVDGCLCVANGTLDGELRGRAMQGGGGLRRRSWATGK